jgi:hypothetical protein
MRNERVREAKVMSEARVLTAAGDLVCGPHTSV